MAQAHATQTTQTTQEKNECQTPAPGESTVDARRATGTSLPFIFHSIVHASGSVIGLGLQDTIRFSTSGPLNHTADSQREQQPQVRHAAARQPLFGGAYSYESSPSPPASSHLEYIQRRCHV